MYLLNPPEPTDPGWDFLLGYVEDGSVRPETGAVAAAKARAKRLGHDVQIVKTSDDSNDLWLVRIVHPDGTTTMPA